MTDREIVERCRRYFEHALTTKSAKYSPVIRMEMAKLCMEFGWQMQEAKHEPPRLMIGGGRG